MELLTFTRERSVELAEFLEDVCSSPFNFEGEDPLWHSSCNHKHLWLLEYLADSNEWIDTDYRARFVDHILQHWRSRLKGLLPYWDVGFRLYVYEDAAPTISVVGETPKGFPYQTGTAVEVASIRDIVKLYSARSWKSRFEIGGWDISRRRILNVIETNSGSIGRRSCERLGLPVGKLRLLIANMGLAREVNAIRKKFQRRPADFPECPNGSGEWRFFERRLPPRFR